MLVAGGVVAGLRFIVTVRIVQGMARGRCGVSRTIVCLHPSRKAPVGGGSPIACTSGWDVPMT
jgi:hypothetical protein